MHMLSLGVLATDFSGTVWDRAERGTVALLASCPWCSLHTIVTAYYSHILKGCCGSCGDPMTDCALGG